LPAGLEETGFAFAAGFDLETDFGEDFAADFFDEALAMASRRCMSETAAALHHGCLLTRKRLPPDIRVVGHGRLQIVTESDKSRCFVTRCVTI